MPCSGWHLGIHNSSLVTIDSYFPQVIVFELSPPLSPGGPRIAASSPASWPSLAPQGTPTSLIIGIPPLDCPFPKFPAVLNCRKQTKGGASEAGTEPSPKVVAGRGTLSILGQRPSNGLGNRRHGLNSWGGFCPELAPPNSLTLA